MLHDHQHGGCDVTCKPAIDNRPLPHSCKQKAPTRGLRWTKCSRTSLERLLWGQKKMAVVKRWPLCGGSTV